MFKVRIGADQMKNPIRTFLLFISLVVFSGSMKAEAIEPVLASGRMSEADARLLDDFGLQAVTPIERKTVLGVRGAGGAAQTTGFSFVSGILVDSDTTSNIFGLDANFAFASLTLDDPFRIVDPVHQHQAQLELELTVDDYFSTILGGAGGAATALFR
ncbi:MAG TPA: hypothetical protein DEF45_13625 [Rhodopirellula sp.]|nr:hypothetical protein [Rhodopirellula sp.]